MAQRLTETNCPACSTRIVDVPVARPRSGGRGKVVTTRLPQWRSDDDDDDVTARRTVGGGAANGEVTVIRSAWDVPRGQRLNFLREKLCEAIDAQEELRQYVSQSEARMEKMIESRVEAAVAAALQRVGVPVNNTSYYPSPVHPTTASMYQQSAALSGIHHPSGLVDAGGSSGSSESLVSRIRTLGARLETEKRARTEEVADLQMQLKQLRLTLDGIRGTDAQAVHRAVAAETSATATGGGGGSFDAAAVRNVFREMEPQIVARLQAEMHESAEHFRKLLQRHQDLVNTLVTDGVAAAERNVERKSSTTESEVIRLRAELQDHRSGTRKAFASLASTLHVAAPVV